MGKESGKGHAVMSSTLAKALIEAGVQHYDLGGFVNDVAHAYGGSPLTGFAGDYINRGLTGGALNNPFGNAIGGKSPYGGLPGQNNFEPRDPGGIEGSITGARGRQNEVYGQQQALAQALLAQSQGQGGPNVAQAQLGQATAQNIGHQSALMASQRGASANPALIARQAAMQGAAIQQQSSGQAATLQAQQALAAQQSLGQQQQNMGSLALNQQALEGGMLQNINNTNAQVAAGNAQRQGQMWGSVLQAVPFAMNAFNGSGGGGAAMSDPNAGAMSGYQAVSQGGLINGKAPVKGDSEENDVVPALLSPGEAVIPKSIMESPNMEAKALEFLKHLKKNKGGYADVIESRSKKMSRGGRAC